MGVKYRFGIRTFFSQSFQLSDFQPEFLKEAILLLKENNIPCGAYYPRPVNTQTAYAKWNTRSLPVCEKLSKTVLSIPMHPYLEVEAQDYVIAKMNEFAAKKSQKVA